MIPELIVLDILPSADPISISYEPALEPKEPLAPAVGQAKCVGIPEDRESKGFESFIGVFG